MNTTQKIITYSLTGLAALALALTVECKKTNSLNYEMRFVYSDTNCDGKYDENTAEYFVDGSVRKPHQARKISEQSEQNLIEAGYSDLLSKHEAIIFRDCKGKDISRITRDDQIKMRIK
jgi:hypothetical protein